MITLNKLAATLMHKYHAHCATDITGFGLLGHASNLLSNQIDKKSLNFYIHTLPLIKNTLKVNTIRNGGFKLHLGLSAETSGGLFICLPANQVNGFINEFNQHDQQKLFTPYVIGQVQKGDGKVILKEDLNFIEI